MFGRATITLGIDPHSSFKCKTSSHNQSLHHCKNQLHILYYYYYYIHLMAFFSQDNLGKPASER